MGQANQLPPELLKWLYRVLQPEYQNAMLVYQDVSLVLMVFSALKPRTRVYDDEYGRSRLLLNLYGSMAYTQNGAPFSAPIEVWFPQEYPREPPVVYVVPNSQTLLNPNNWMDQNGRIYHPLLSSWSATFGSQTSNEGIQPNQNRLLVLFNTIQECFDRQSPVYARPASLATSPPPPPLPHPKPVKATPTVKSPPPLPTKTVRSPVQSPSPVLFATPVRPATPQAQPVQQTLPPPVPANPVRAQVSRDLPAKLQQILENDVRPFFAGDIISVLDSVQQKLYDLQNRRDALKNVAGAYEDKAKQNESIVQKAEDELQKTIEKANSAPEPDIDRVFAAETVVYNQLYDLVATNESISDTLYVLERAHDDGSVPFNAYMKHARGLAREQFMVKALMNKIADVCQLDTVV
ncbi:unnamed protein product [Kuraishia capsulata CBS 1993]|uniref:UEV domain-containing protein n=1 Tax=Kuraishia capsulata CBS 1993 TaxID=1382522 RepID=W6MGJ0_9ASCO|nr:uncharacterized protein KUCA_T00000604001 [Kuraishia capsulata CBS 1993]CDK24638.1 unnamed protein product [Kuraishia capsulata CBS 1993]